MFSEQREQKVSIKKEVFIDKLYCWIEKGETQKVIDFFEAYPEMKNKYMATSNIWSPAMYACRYGRKDLLKYFIDNNYKLQYSSPYTLIHAACFGHELDILKYLIDEKKMSVTPLTYETTPLKYCIKTDNLPIIEFLISRGAYFIYGDFHNNITGSEKQQDGTIIYKSKQLIRDKKGNKSVETLDIPQSLVSKFNEAKNHQDQGNAKDFIKWFRCRSWLFICHLQYSKSKALNNKKAEALGRLAYNQHSKLIKSFLVGPTVNN